ncbi:MAG: hypothetical protein EHM55_01775 [Acidobacteria bacterium]|nr:MAG: hypothetical protein EHM55_01775 [Acidobacteriota bacterium]
MEQGLGSATSIVAARDSKVAWRAELQLLVACARPTASPETAERIRALAQEPMEWPYVLALAGEHGVRPLLYRSLHCICPDIVPEAVLKDLLDFVRSDVAHNLSQNVELLRLLEGLKARGIAAIPFKGGVLASWAYADPALRESGDIDIVVRKRDLREAVAFLATHGYRRRTTEPHDAIEDTNDEQLGRYLRFDSTDGLASVDLQTSLEAPHFAFALDSDELWDRAVSRTFAGQTVLSFCAEDLLILLCVHGTKDVWFKLKWICDIAEFIGSDRGFNWDQVLYRATHLRAKRKLLLGCLLAHDLLGADAPERILAHVRQEPTVRAAAETIIKKYSLPNRRFTDAERAALYFRTDDPLGRTSRILRYGRRSLKVIVVPSDNDRRCLSLPNWLSPAYYLVRPIRLMAKFGRSPRLAVQAVRDLFERLD